MDDSKTDDLVTLKKYSFKFNGLDFDGDKFKLDLVLSIDPNQTENDEVDVNNTENETSDEVLRILLLRKEIKQDDGNNDVNETENTSEDNEESHQSNDKIPEDPSDDTEEVSSDDVDLEVEEVDINVDDINDNIEMQMNLEKDNLFMIYDILNEKLRSNIFQSVSKYLRRKSFSSVISILMILFLKIVIVRMNTTVMGAII